MGWRIPWRLRRARCMRRWRRGWRRFAGMNGVAGVSEGRNVKVSVADVRVEHEVKLGDFTTWVERKAGRRGGDSAAEDTGDFGDGSGEMTQWGALDTARWRGELAA